MPEHPGLYVLQGLKFVFISRFAQDLESNLARRLRMNRSIDRPGISADFGKNPTLVICPICGPNQTSPVGVSNGLPIVTCQGCNLTYVGECPSMDDTQEFFQEEYIKDSASARELYVNYRRKSLEREAARIRKLMPQGGRLLDVGTASGFFLRQFRDHREWKVEGVEPSRFSAEFARQEFALTVHQGFLADQQFRGETFDVVCSLDAFICHRQPREDMREFYRVLAPGGLLAVEIPGHRFRMMTGSGMLYHSLRGPSLRLNAGVNFYYYTRATLTRLASMAGFEFIASHPEGLPATGNRFSKVAREAYDIASGALYRVTKGNVNFSAKELCIFRKPHAQGNSAPSSTTALAEPESRRVA